MRKILDKLADLFRGRPLTKEERCRRDYARLGPMEQKVVRFLGYDPDTLKAQGKLIDKP